MNRALLHSLAFSVVVAGGVGCPIGAPAEGIGRACTPDGERCPNDHVCRFLDEDDAAAGTGVCAPVIDYGACDAPTWAVGLGDVHDDTVLIDAVDDFAFLRNVTRVEGDVIIKPANAGQTFVLGDLCAMSTVQQVTGSLVVSSTDITTLDGLQGVGFVGKGVGIASNRLLTSLDGLINLIAVLPLGDNDNFDVVIADNAALTNEAIQALRAALDDTHADVRLLVCGNVNAAQQNDQDDCPPSVDALLRR
ncbi:MAG TPA: hypothetical protein VGF99_06585 [Myxococcota bacterium]